MNQITSIHTIQLEDNTYKALIKLINEHYEEATICDKETSTLYNMFLGENK
jgi:hypothetical protein